MIAAPSMVKQTLIWVSFVGVLLLAPLAGCGGDDDDADKEAKPIGGTFVGKVSGTKAFVAVAAGPTVEGRDRRDVKVFVCDARRVCEWFPGSATRNSFVASSDDRDAKAKGKLSGKAVTGTIELPGGKTVRYEASQATATAGLYDLTVSSEGKIRGASAAGVALTGTSTLPSLGNGTIKLADGKRLKFDVTRAAGDGIRLRAGRVRLIVLPGGELRGAGKSRRAEGGGGSDFFTRSSK